MALIRNVVVDGQRWGPANGRVDPPAEIARLITNPDCWDDAPATDEAPVVSSPQPAEAPVAPPADDPRPVAPDTDVDPAGDDPVNDLDAFTKDDLYELGRLHDLPVTRRMSKAELMAMVEVVA